MVIRLCLFFLLYPYLMNNLFSVVIEYLVNDQDLIPVSNNYFFIIKL